VETCAELMRRAAVFYESRDVIKNSEFSVAENDRSSETGRRERERERERERGDGGERIAAALLLRIERGGFRYPRIAVAAPD